MKWISNKTLFNIHGWLGLNLGLLLFVICFSGTFATLSGEVDWLLNEDMRIEKKDAPVQWQKMYQSLNLEYPDGKITGITKHSSRASKLDRFASVSYVQMPNGQTRKVYLDPYSGSIQGSTSFFNVQRFFRSYHRRFFDGSRGILIVTLSSFFLLFSALTGFLFYKGWLKNLFKLRFSKGIKTLFSDAHKLTGIWALIFTLLIALTGVFYFAELMIQNGDNYELLIPDAPDKIERADRAQFGPNPQLLSADEYIASAKESFPNLQVTSIRLPQHANDFVSVDGQAGNPVTRNRANKVYLHPFSGDVVHIQYSSELNTAEFITDIADPLHFGYFWGLSTKIIWFIFGLALSFAILSGPYLWYIRGMDKMKRKLKRLKSRTTSKHKEVAMAGFSGKYLTLSRGAIISTILIVVYLMVTAIGTVQDGIHSYGPLPEDRVEVIKKVNLGPWDVNMKCEYPCSMEKGTRISASFQNEGLPNYTSLHLEMISSQNESISIPFSGSARNPFLTFQDGVGKIGQTAMQVRLETPLGQEFTAPITKSSWQKAKSNLGARYQSYPDRAYPMVPFGVYAYIGGWSLLTIFIIIGWTYFLVKASRKQKALKLSGHS